MSVAQLRSYAFEFAAFAIPLCAYIAYAMPDVGLWDTGEMAVVPYIFGIAHPTGFPLFVIAGWVFTHLFAVGNVAWRMSIMSGLSTALASWLLYRAGRTHGAAAGALFGAFIFAFGTVTWTRATRPEVHTTALLLCAVAIVIAQSIRRGESVRFAWAVPVTLALAVAVHPVALWIFPGVAVFVAAAWRALPASARDGLIHRLAAGSALGAALFAAAYASVPWRSQVATLTHADPTLRLGFAPGMPFWDYSHPSSWSQFLWFIRGAQFAPGSAMLGVFAVPAYPSYLATVFPSIAHEFPLALLAFSALGFAALMKRDRVSALAYALLVVCGWPFAALYHIEIDSDRYLLVSFWALALTIGVGANGTVEYLRNRRFTPAANSALAAVSGIVALSGAIAVLATSLPALQHTDGHEGRAVIDRIVQNTPDNAVIVSSWVYATPLAYAAYVEHSFGHRIVVAADSAGIADQFPRLAAMQPLYIIDDNVPPFTDSHVTLTTKSATFPLLIEVTACHPVNGRESANSPGPRRPRC